MLERLKQSVIGTPAEPMARAVYDSVSQSRAFMMMQARGGRQDKLYDVQSMDVMRRVLSRTSNCVDAGSHRGDFLRWMLKFAPEGRHHAFEPLPGMYEILESRFSHLSNVQLHRVGLSDADGTDTFHHVLDAPGLSALRKRTDDGEATAEIEIRTVRLDDVVPESVEIDLMKVDVEGAELQVFRGGERVITRDRPVILFEHGLGAADFFDATPRDIHALLCDAYGLRVALLGDWLAGSAAGGMSADAFEDQFANRRNFFFIAYPP